MNIPKSVLGTAPFNRGSLAVRVDPSIAATWAANVRRGLAYELTVPNQPTNVVATVGNGQATLSWGASPNYEITDYIVQYSSDLGGTWKTFDDGVSSGTTATVTGLSNGVPYVFRVAAVNRIGMGNYSGSSAAITPTPEVVIRVSSGQIAADGAPRSGATQLIKRGLGTLIIDKANSHTGGTVVEEGTVIVRNTNGLGSGILAIGSESQASLDIHGDNVSVGGLRIAASGLLDVGYGRLTIAAGGYSLPDVLGLLRSGYASQWSGTSGLVSRTAGSVSGGGLGYAINDDGSLTFGFAAAGDTNLDGTVDILDVSAMLASSKFNTGESASWSEGDSNYDGVIDILDISDLLGASLFNAGPYIPATPSQAQAQASPTTLSAADAAFLAFAETSASGATRPKRLRFAG